MKAVIFGATKGIGRAIARALAERGDDVFLLGIGEDDLARSASDVVARHASGPDTKVGTAVCDLLDPFIY